MKLRDSFIIEGTLTLNTISDAVSTNYTALFVDNNVVKKRILGNIIDYNISDVLRNIGYSMPNIFTPGSNITPTNSNISFSLASQTINTFFAAPSIGNGTPSFRKIVASDIADTGVLFAETDPKGVKGIAFSGTTTKTLTITLNDNTTQTASFSDLNTTYTAGNGLTLSGTAFSITKATATGTGNVVSDYNVTSTGIQLVKGITAMETSHVANAITSTNIDNWNSAESNAITKSRASLITSTSATGVSNVATTNTNTYLNITQNGASPGSSTQVTGAGGITVSSDASGKITINGTNESDKNFIYEQNFPLATWEINHNLNKKPSVTVTDSANTTVEGQIIINDGVKVLITFNAPFSGTAILN